MTNPTATTDTTTDDEFPYVYFVAYAQGQAGRGLGFGNHAVGTRRPVTTFEDTQEFQRTIARAKGFPDGTVAVVSYQLICGPDEREV